MSLRTGPFKTLREAKEIDAYDTWIECDEVITVQGNQLKIFVEVSEDDCTTMQLKAAVSEDKINYFEFHDDDDDIFFGPHTADIGKRIIDLSSLNLCPLQTVKIYFQCAAGVGTAKVKIQALSFDA